MNNFIQKIRDGLYYGLGFGLGLFIILGVIFSVFAFVEPSSSPSSDYVLNWNSPLNALHNNTNSRVEEIYSTTTGMSANTGMYDNKIPANFNPPNDYTMICFKDGSTFNDQMDGGDSTNDGVNCEPGNVGFIIEADERASATWSNAKHICLENGMRLSEPFEFQFSCNNAGTFGLTAMTGNHEWASNFALPMHYEGNHGTGVSVMGSSGCYYVVWTWVGSHDGSVVSYPYRCVK